MRRLPPREPPPERRLRRETPRPEGPFDRLLKRKPERDPAPLIIGGTIAFLALVIVLVFAFSSIFGGGDGPGTGDTVDVAPGVRGRLVQIPSLPPGLVAASEYWELQADSDFPGAIIGLPLTERAQEPTGYGFYTFLGERWQRVGDIRVELDGRVAEGNFSDVPDNLAVLRVVSQTYQVAASLPRNGSLHPEAQANIVSPRDYTPSADGGVLGEPTNLPSGAFTVMPTIVGSGADTSSIVNEIVASDTLRANHVQQIVSLVQSGEFGGIDLEYLSVDPSLAAEFTSFVSSLAGELQRNNARLSLTLPPPTNQRQAYEWEALGNSADFIKILPIADPIRYWETMPSALMRLVNDVDPRKVMLVLNPFSVEATGDIARPIGYLNAMVEAADAVIREPLNPDDIEPDTTVRLVARNLDEGEGASTLRWSDDAAAVTFTTGGTERRTIYIENRYSFGFKLEQVQAFGLAGVAVADGSSQSDVANVWPSVRELVSAATVSLARPSDAMLQPAWQAPDGGNLGAGAGTTATWQASDAGQYNIVLVVSDGERRFGRVTVVSVGEGPQTSPTPAVTFPPETPTPEPTPAPTPEPTPTPEGTMGAEVGILADGDDGDSVFTNTEITSPGSTVVYLVTIDNDSAVPVTITSLVDSVYGEIECVTATGANVIGLVLSPDDGDGPGLMDGGDDEVQCTFTRTAPAEPGITLTNTVTLVVTASDGRTATDTDSTTITTSGGEE